MSIKNSFIALFTAVFLLGCAERSLYIYDKEDKIVGECSAGYDWHLYGIQDSIDYILHKCAKGHVDNGYRISDETILSKDFSLPVAPPGKTWNKKLAMQEFKAGRITEKKLGYILAEIEYRHIMTRRAAEKQLAKKEITQAQFDQIVADSKRIWQGE
ncbi:MAG: hypothetical protein ACFHVJ_11565 [Aestuariibacter sp.]